MQAIVLICIQAARSLETFVIVSKSCESPGVRSETGSFSVARADKSWNRDLPGGATMAMMTHHPENCHVSEKLLFIKLLYNEVTVMYSSAEHKRGKRDTHFWLYTGCDFLLASKTRAM